MTSDEFYSILANMPLPEPVFWRLYYDDAGSPITYSMEDLPGNYIDIDPETYILGSNNVRVVNRVLKHFTIKTTEKLEPYKTGTQCHTQDISVMVQQNGTHWSKQTYGLDSN